MSIHKHLVLSLGICIAGSLAVSLRAQDSDENAGAYTTFGVSVLKGELVRGRQVQRVMISAGTNQFMIVAPEGLRPDTTRPDRIVFEAEDNSYFLVFRMTGRASEDYTSSSSCRALAASQFVGAEVKDEFSLSAAGASGPAFDLDWPLKNSHDRFVRVAYIPSRAGLLEFSLISGTKDLTQARFDFDALLGGFCSNEHGKIKVIRVPDNS